MTEEYSAKTTGASFSELMTAFETTEEKIEKRIGIKAKIPMPTPEGRPTTIRLLWSKDDELKPIAVMKKSNPGFRGGVAYFMTCELVDIPGEKQLSLSKSLFGSIAAAAKERKLAFEDMIGKVGDISATYFTAAPRIARQGTCLHCKGAGCKACTVTGKGVDSGVVTGLQTPTVYNFQLRDDLNKPISAESAATQFD